MTLPAWREEPIAKKHNRKGFDCGQADLNGFLAKYARQAHESGASKTYVAVDNAGNPAILGFYTLSPALIDFNLAPEAARPAGGGRHSDLIVGRSYSGPWESAMAGKGSTRNKRLR